MAKKAASRRKTRKLARGGAANPAAASRVTVGSWEDDPGDPKMHPANAPITVAPPDPGATPLPFKLSGRAPAPRVYQRGTPEFRFYAAAAALRRTSDFWGSMIGATTKWQIGNVLPVSLDDGVDLNAFYTRGGFGASPGLHFFHDTVASHTFFSGESPDVVCHEMGHAVLDAIRPQLFDAQAIEVPAFHESFGDMSAILSALQVETFRDGVIRETNGTLNRSSRLSRLAEQLGFAIRVQHPDLVDADCLRNAANSFFYRDPQTLPPVAPAVQLSSEPHSFSRVFTAAFLDILAGVFKAQAASPSSADLLTAAQDVARLLVASVRVAPVVPDFYSQVAAHMIDAGEQPPFRGKYRDTLKSAFVRRGILSLQGAIAVTGGRRKRGRKSALTIAAQSERALPMTTMSGAHYGLSESVLNVFTAEEPKQFAVTSSSLMLGPVEPRSPQNAAESFTEDLFQRGRVDVGNHASADAGLQHLLATKTHVIVREQGNLVLRRRTFDCGFS